MELIRGIKVPGVLWIALIIVGVALVHENTSNPLYYDIAIMVAGMLLRSVTNNRAELEEYQQMLEILKNQLQRKSQEPPSNMRSSSDRGLESTLDAATIEATDFHLETIQPPPPVARFLFG